MFPLLRRTLVQALIISLLMHAVLLTSVVSLFPAVFDVPAATINVIMGRGSHGVPANAVKPDALPAAKPLPENLKPTSPDAAKILTRQTVVAPDAPVVRAVPPVQTPAHEGGGVTPSATALAGAVSGSGGTAAALAHEGANADDFRQYRMSLAASARRFKRYPALAKERGWEGTVEVAIDVHTSIPAPSVVLVSSSGRSVLDEQALEMMLQAARITALPGGLKGRDFRILLPVKFSLDENQ